MNCPKCGSPNVSVNAVTETKTKTRWGCGCLFHWVALLFPKYKSKTTTQAVCQNCGNRWNVKSYEVRRNSTNAVYQQGQGNNAQSAQYAAVPDEPFYKKMWFLIVCGIFMPPIGIALIWLIHKDWDKKKKYIATGIMAVWFIIMLCSGGGDENTPPAVSDSDLISTILVGDEPGEYGEWRVMNDNTDLEDNYIAYKLPAGDYTATNLDPDYPVWIYVYSDEVIVQDGWEVNADCAANFGLEVNESADFSIPEGYYIELFGSEHGTKVLIEER